MGERADGVNREVEPMAVDETAALAKWVIPASHFLEAWGDTAAPDGTVAIQQPAIRPFNGSKTAAELVAAISGYKDRSSYDIVRNYWVGVLPGEKEQAWRKALHDGVIPDSAA